LGREDEKLEKTILPAFEMTFGMDKNKAHTLKVSNLKEL